MRGASLELAPAPAILGAHVLVLLWLLETRAEGGLVTVIVLSAFLFCLGLTLPRYLEAGRLVFTPPLVLFGLLVLYVIPVTLEAMLVGAEPFRVWSGPALVQTLALASAALAAWLVDEPSGASEIASFLERRQASLRGVVYVLLVAGILLALWRFPSPDELRAYFLETSYYDKHVYFAGQTYRGLFIGCFEVAGIVAAALLAMPRARRTGSLAWDLAPFLVAAASGLNQGYRTTVMLILSQYLVARSFWAGSAVRALRLLALFGVLGPSFMIWAHVRSLVSTEGILDPQGLLEQVQVAEWQRLEVSELAAGLFNARELLALLDSGAWSHRWGSTYVIDPLVAMVPLAVWPGRPDALQIQFTGAVDPSYPAGGTMSFSFVLEGLLNFGGLGVVAATLVLAVALARLRASQRRAASSDRPLRWLALFVIQGQLFFYVRDDFGDLVRRIAIALAVLVAGWAAHGAVRAIRIQGPASTSTGARWDRR